jgi:uncharacterized membrane protein
MLIVLPLCLFGLSVFFDAAGKTSRAPVWGTVAYGNLVGGMIVAALTLGIQFSESRFRPCRTRAYRATLMHHILSLTAIVLFGISLAYRIGDPSQAPENTAVWASIIGLLVSALAGWIATLRPTFL